MVKLFVMIVPLLTFIGVIIIVAIYLGFQGNRKTRDKGNRRSTDMH